MMMQQGKDDFIIIQIVTMFLVDRNNAIEKANMNLYMKMKAILLNSKDSMRMQANRKYQFYDLIYY